ncbi:general stress protein [uncultured Sphingomonas sp.]|uniref:general stress protein n=1 Tax=uncultured Sphingomonas sp. TaxID=158754 RepID=UPI0025DAA5AB|nr:general stress protein [uncultured Sphingomonas sp.]
MSRTITRLFDDYSDAKAAVHALEQLGVPHDDLSIIANNAHGEHEVSDVNAHGDVSRGASTGAALGGVGGLLAGLGLLAIPGLGPIVAAGWLASTAAGAAIGGIGGAATGSLVGALKNAGESEEDANVYSEGVRRGGTLVSARVPDDRAAEAEAVLNRHRGVDAGTRGAAYRQSGWSQFDSDAPAYTRDEIARERATYREPTAL